MQNNTQFFIFLCCIKLFFYLLEKKEKNTQKIVFFTHIPAPGCFTPSHCKFTRKTQVWVDVFFSTCYEIMSSNSVIYATFSCIFTVGWLFFEYWTIKCWKNRSNNDCCIIQRHENVCLMAGTHTRVLKLIF